MVRWNRGADPPDNANPIYFTRVEQRGSDRRFGLRGRLPARSAGAMSVCQRTWRRTTGRWRPRGRPLPREAANNDDAVLDASPSQHNKQRTVQRTLTGEAPWREEGGQT